MTKFVRSIFNLRMLAVFLMGFSSGLPLLLVGGTLKAWFTDAGMDLTSIGLFSLVGLPYTLKFIWSPFLDGLVPPFLGRRRGWLILSQLGLALALVALAKSNPTAAPGLVATIALVVAFLSATQDIAVDAYRREILETEELGFGNSLYVTGYRFAMMFSGAFALFLADVMPWSSVYLIMAGGMVVGLATTIFAPEPKLEHAPPKNIKEAVIDPFIDFFSRPGAWWILAFILLYKVGDNMASEMTMPFYLKIGFTKTEVGAVVKVFGIWAVIVGGLIGGTMILKIGLRKALWIFGFLQAISTLGFAWLAQVGPNIPALTAVISFENLSGGMGTAAYVAFMASLTNKKFTATQYALLTSLMGVPRVIIAAPTGYLAEIMGWPMFFAMCAFAAAPGMLLLMKMGQWAVQAEDSTPPPNQSATQPATVS